MSTGTEQETLLSLHEITKEYFGVPALDHVSLEIKKGEIHGLIGENGAGKSTLIKIISGAIAPTEGTLYFQQKPLKVSAPIDAMKKGIGVVYQEFNLFPNLSVYENIFFGMEIKHHGIIHRKEMIKKADEIIKNLGFHFSSQEKVSDLSTAYQQIVEIAKCINHHISLIIMDEPSAPLTENEVKEMFRVVRAMNHQGVTVIYISHKLNEISELTDRISVLRDGHYIGTRKTSDLSENEMIKLMVGRDITEIYPDKAGSLDEVILRCEHLQSRIIKDASFELKKGEVLGFGGLVGAGRTELMRLLFGADSKAKGTILLNGKEIHIRSPKDAIANGIGLIPEDRKLHGLILNKSIYMNVVIASIALYTSKLLRIVNFRKAEKDIQVFYDRLKIKATGTQQTVSNLSGGNQQKVVLAKWLLRNCDILILDEPTRGIDVGAKQEIYQLIKELGESGKSIIVISSEMPELIGVSHRILVMREGEIKGELKGNKISQEAIMRLASEGGC